MLSGMIMPAPMTDFVRHFGMGGRSLRVEDSSQSFEPDG
jgi:hypothetical protein